MPENYTGECETRYSIPFLACNLLWVAYLIVSCSPVHYEPELLGKPSLSSYPEARQLAYEWSPDSRFIQATWRFYPEEQRPPVTYTFVSPERHDFLLIRIDENETSTVEGDWPEERPYGVEIDVSSLALSSEDAWQIILDEGGYEYEARNNTYGDHVFFDLGRLNEYQGDGPIIWQGGFTNTLPQAQLYVTIYDDNGQLAKVKAYGASEQAAWLYEVAETRELTIGESAVYFDHMTIIVVGVDNSLGNDDVDILIESSEVTSFTRQPRSYSDLEIGDPFYFGDFVVEVLSSSGDRAMIKVFPLTRWFMEPEELSN